MIRYALKCTNDHAFDSWFASAAAFDTVKAAGMVQCPECGSAQVEKALMAPKVTPGRKAALSQPDTDQQKELAKLKAHVEENSDYVGMRFAAEARKMHDGELPHRAIYGEAKLAEAKKLIEDGVPVAPLPFVPQRKTN